MTGNELPVLSGLTVTVPGTAMAWEDTLKSFGRLPMAQASGCVNSSTGASNSNAHATERLW